MSPLGQKADVTSLESDVCVTPESRHHPNIIATALDHSPDGRGLLAVEHRAEIAHIEPSAARFTFETRSACIPTPR